MSVPASNAAGATLADRYRSVRAKTRALSEPLAVEDCVVQSMPDVSPTKWHLAHVTWFFETFVLDRVDGYRVFHPQFEYLFNSYYNAVGAQYPRPRRGLITRPTVAEVMAYREHVDAAMEAALDAGDFDDEARTLIELGLNHEQQHQELLLMDIKHVLFQNPLFPAYRSDAVRRAGSGRAVGWREFDGGEVEIGAAGPGFVYDNEGPRHCRMLEPFALADRLVTNAEYLEFIDDGGYRQSRLWLSDGWTTVQNEGWRAPLYWIERDGDWFEFTLRGLEPLNPASPVTHVSFYEAEAYATWRGFRLPTECEWETAARECAIAGNFLDDDCFHPQPATGDQLFGDAWEWTRSAYGPYPGYRPPAGAVGEYNGKFMCNQMVMRGGACVTPRDHIRPTYRNFFYPHMRWQFGGIRLAR